MRTAAMLLSSLALAVSICSGGDCDGCEIDNAAQSELEALIASSGTVLIGIPNMRCTAAAQAKFAACGTSYASHTFTPSDISTSWSDFALTSDAVWRYMDCAHHTEINGMTMHSYVFVDGTLLGSGFEADNYDCSKFSASGEKAAARRQASTSRAETSLLQPKAEAAHCDH